MNSLVSGLGRFGLAGVLALAGLAGMAEAQSRQPQRAAPAVIEANQPPPVSEITPLEITESGAARHLQLPLGKARIVRLPADVRDVLVADPAIADVVLRTPRIVYLLGRDTGATNAFFFDAKGKEVLRLEVHVDLDTASVQQALTQLLPDTSVKVTAVNRNLFLSGSVRSAVMSENARQIARRFVTGDENVVNLLAVVEDQQVLLQVRVAEVSRTVLKELGVTFQDQLGALGNTRNSAGNPFTTITSLNYANRLATFAGTLAPRFVANSFAFDRGDGDVLTLTINALERNGLIKTLAEPNLTAVSGETANFLAGGEFPIPVAADNGQIAIEFRSFGIGLNFTPMVLNAGRISMRISTEVSALSQSGAITLATISVPALTVRRAESTVELPSGGSLIIAGLIQDNFAATIDGIPGFKDLPILGQFFRNNSLTRTENELVVAVTAYLVRPVERQAMLLPTDGLPPPSDYDLYVLGRLHGMYAKPGSPSAPTALKGPIGYILE
ncbi:MAG: type II and III secretion system protein family protein [Alphaproteobacteria bacterium]|nr:type II and III secretion system protein family protein [Alphaproteobacteria bacterium]